jgi:predicted RND superfamily exporter protein
MKRQKKTNFTLKNLAIAFLFLVITILMIAGNLITKRGGVMEDAIQNEDDLYYLMDKKAKEKLQGTEAFLIILRFPEGINSAEDILKAKKYQQYLTDNLKEVTILGLQNLDSVINYQNSFYPINFTDVENVVFQDAYGNFDIEKWKTKMLQQKNLAKFFVDENFQHINFVVYPNQNYDEIELFRNTVEVLEERDIEEWEWFIKTDIEPADENILVAGWIQGRGLMDGALNADVMMGITLGVLGSFLAFFIFTRSFLQSLITSLFVIGLSVLWVRGEIGLLNLLGIEIKERVFILMAYTNCIVQGVSFSLHMFESFNEVDKDIPQIEVNRKWRIAKKQVIESIAITAIIAFVGFATLLNFNVKAIQELGILSALGVLNLWFLSTVLAPALHSLFYCPKKSKNKIVALGKNKPKKKRSFTLIFLNKINHWLASHWLGKILILFILIGLGLAVFVGFKNDELVIGSKTLEYLKGTIIDRSNDYLKQEDNLGFSSFEFIVTANDKESEVFHNLDFTREVYQFSKEVEKIDNVRGVNSILNTVEQIANVSGKDFVETDVELKQVFDVYLAEQLTSEITEQLYNAESYRFTITTAAENSNDWGKISDEVLELSKNYSQIDEVLFFGDSALYPQVDSYIIQGKTLNVVTSQVAVVFICVLWLFFTLRRLNNKFKRFTVSVKTGLVMSLPLLFATECILLVMMIFKVPLDISTAMIGVTAIAASIDFSIYFVAEYKKALFFTKKDALTESIDKEGNVILMDMFLNQLFFLPLMLSSFIPVQRLGWMLAIMLFFAAIGALLIMPSLLVWAFKNSRDKYGDDNLYL